MLLDCSISGTKLSYVSSAAGESFATSFSDSDSAWMQKAAQFSIDREKLGHFEAVFIGKESKKWLGELFLNSSVRELRMLATTGYCVKCKAKREMKGEKAVTMKNGRNALTGTCSVCGTKMFKIGGGGGAKVKAKVKAGGKKKAAKKKK